MEDIWYYFWFGEPSIELSFIGRSFMDDVLICLSLQVGAPSMLDTIEHADYLPLHIAHTEDVQTRA